MIKKLIEQIKYSEANESEMKAVQHIFTFILGAKARNDFEKIEMLIKEPDIFSLKYTYLLCIMSMTYGLKENIPDFMNFFDQIKELTKEEVSEEEFNLIYGDFE